MGGEVRRVRSEVRRELSRENPLGRSRPILRCPAWTPEIPSLGQILLNMTNIDSNKRLLVNFG